MPARIAHADDTELTAEIDVASLPRAAALARGADYDQEVQLNRVSCFSGRLGIRVCLPAATFNDGDAIGSLSRRHPQRGGGHAGSFRPRDWTALPISLYAWCQRAICSDRHRPEYERVRVVRVESSDCNVINRSGDAGFLSELRTAAAAAPSCPRSVAIRDRSALSSICARCKDKWTSRCGCREPWSPAGFWHWRWAASSDFYGIITTVSRRRNETG